MVGSSQHLVVAREGTLAAPAPVVGRRSLVRKPTRPKLTPRHGTGVSRNAAAARAASCRRRPARRPARPRSSSTISTPALGAAPASRSSASPIRSGRPWVTTATRRHRAAAQRRWTACCDLGRCRHRWWRRGVVRPEPGAAGYSRFPAGPGRRRIAHSEDGDAELGDEPRHVAQHLAGAPRGRARLPSRTCSRPASNCGLTSTTPRHGAAQARRHRRQHQPQRDERDVGGDERRAGTAARPASGRGR